MTTTYSYACKDYSRMEGCSGHFVAESEKEIWQLVEVHAQVARGEDPSTWTADDRAALKELIRSE